MFQTIDFHIPELESMKVYPSALYFLGNVSLLKRPKIAIVGTRRPSAYTKAYTQMLARKLSQNGLCIVSGGAQGVDAIAHVGAKSNNTIMAAGTGLDIRYPAINQKLIAEIELHGLVISQFEAGKPSTKWNFPLRNELIVALGDELIVTQADLKSGSMRSIEYALKMQKQIYVLPQRLGESEGTHWLLKQNLAKSIDDIETFCGRFGSIPNVEDNAFLTYCDTQPLYHDAVERFSKEVFEYECLGQIIVENGRIKRA